MKRLFIFLFVVLISSKCFATSNQDTIKVKLSETPTITADCGVMTLGRIFEFMRNMDTFHIIVLCPETYGKCFFKKGVEYKIVVTEDLSDIQNYYIANINKPYKKLLLAKNISLIN